MLASDVTRNRANNSPDVIPQGQLICFSLKPSVLVSKVEGEPEKEGVVDEFQAGIAQTILNGVV